MNRLIRLIIAFIAIMLVTFIIFLPFRLQNIFRRATCLIAYKLKDLKFMTNLIIEQKQESTIIEKEIEEEEYDEMTEKNEEVSILFSGGWDSTLAAFKLCELFKRVHLLTCYHSNSDFVENSKVNVNKLKNRFGRDKIVHVIIDIDQLKEKLYHDKWREGIKKYGLFLINCECSACRIAMFAHMIIYCLENNIHYCAAGEVKVAPLGLIPGLSDKLQEFKKKICNDYGIVYLSPVYYEKNPHRRLFELGLIDKEVKHRKFPYEYLFHEAQPTCYKDPFGPIFNKFYYLPYHGKKVSEENKLKYFTEKINVASKWIKETK